MQILIYKSLKHSYLRITDGLLGTPKGWRCQCVGGTSICIRALAQPLKQICAQIQRG
jgi:hypothetical protein